jgi:hypothetical protein
MALHDLKRRGTRPQRRRSWPITARTSNWKFSTATVPPGDAESLLRLQDRCGDMSTRAAGCSALVDPDLSSLSPHGSAAKR